MNRGRLNPLLFIVIFLSAPVTWSAARAWQLPVELLDHNTRIRFEVDSTWHTVHGLTSGITGTVLQDLTSVHGQVRLPVSSFNTDNESRDEKLRKVMAASEYPEVIYDIASVDAHCPPSIESEPGECDARINGTLTIRGVARSHPLQVHLQNVGEHLFVRGSTDIEWGAFGVEDPSILIASVDPVVKVLFEVDLRGHLPEENIDAERS